MRAIVYRSYGGVTKLVLEDITKPTPGRDQILVKVAASAVNPVDWKRASGDMRVIMPVKFPAVPGFDLAGEVVAVGEGVTQFSAGMRVHSRSQEGSGGGCAEFAVVNVNVTAKIPEGLSYAEAAGLPLAGMTALQGLRDEALMPTSGATEHVLIVGASGGVGHLGVQIAKAMGAKVTGVCSEKNAALVKDLGADDVIDYKKANAFEGKGPFDVILDCVAGDPSVWLPMLAEKGRYASCMPSPKTFLRSFINFAVGKRVRPVMLKSNAKDLAWLDQLVEQKKLKIVIDKRFPMEQLGAAWERSMSGRACGKIIVEVA